MITGLTSRIHSVVEKNDISVQPDTEDIVIETGWLDELPWPQRPSQRSAGVDGKISLQKDSRFDVVKFFVPVCITSPGVVFEQKFNR